MSKISNVLSKLTARFNSDDVITFKKKDGFAEVKSWAHTGSPELNWNLRTYGLPTGIIEIAGRSRSGKTTEGLEAMKYFLDENPETGLACILSSENRDNKDYAVQLGIDPSRVVIIKIHYVEQMFVRVSKFVKDAHALFDEAVIKEKPKFFFLWDSLGATLSKAEYDALRANVENMDKAAAKGEELEKLQEPKMMAFAKSAKMFAKGLVGLCYTNVIHFVILNHQYEQNVKGVTSRKSTGGEWVELMPTLRLQMRVTEMKKIDDVEVAQISEVKVIKNDFGSRQKTYIRILLGYGIILSEEDIDYAVERGIIQKPSKTVYTALNGKLRWKSDRELYQLYYDQNPLLDTLGKVITAARHRDLREWRKKMMEEAEVVEE
nr:MAG TPA: Protein recA [Caudoviricetes sp.]